MRATNACSDTLSGEHLISQGVLGVLADKAVTVSGLPWLKGQSKSLGFGALTANCLCTRHNSLLSPIDAAGAKFFEAVQNCGTTTARPPLQYLLSGHDLERWLLRSLAVLGVSRNLAVEDTALDQEFIERLDVVHLLENPKAWVRRGLYLVGVQGQVFRQRHDVQMAPLIRRGTDELLGITLDMQGLALAILAADQDTAGTGLDRAFYRPSAIVFDMGDVRHRIRLSWEDALPHDEVTLTWKR